jgi:hypothetical protein
VFENRVINKTLDSNRQEVIGGWKKSFLTRSLLNTPFLKIGYY